MQRAQAGNPVYVQPPQWQVTAVTIINNDNGEVLWLQDGDLWRLPGGIGQNLEAPWETAVRHTQSQTNQPVQLTNLVGVYSHPAQPALTLAFSATKLNNLKSEHAWFLPGNEPEVVDASHKRIVLDAANPGEATSFHRDTAVPFFTPDH